MRIAEQNIGSNISREKHALLGYKSKPFSEFMLAYPADIRSVQCNGTFRHVIEAGNQIYQRGFSASGTADNRGSFPGFCRKCYIMKDIFICPRIPEGHVAECEDPFLPAVKCCRMLRIMNHSLAGQHFLHTVCRHCRSGQHNGKHAQHKESHDNLHGVLNKCHHISHLHLTFAYAVGSVPHNKDGDAVHYQHHDRHHKGHSAVNKQVCPGQIPIGLIESLLLMLLCAEGADH